MIKDQRGENIFFSCFKINPPHIGKTIALITKSEDLYHVALMVSDKDMVQNQHLWSLFLIGKDIYHKNI